MRSLVLATLLVLAASLVPPTQATPVCQSLDRVQGGVHAHTENCADAWSWDNVYFNYQWSNTTYVTTTTAAGTVQVAAYSYHYVQTGPSGYFYEYYQHSYGGYATTSDNPLVSQAGVSVANFQNSYNGQCYEATGVQGNSYGPVGSNGASQTLFGGSVSPYVLPCTTQDVQQTLP